MMLKNKSKHSHAKIMQTPEEKAIRKAANFLKKRDGYLICTHKKPDGDTMGSAAALCVALRQLGKTAYIFKNIDITKRYEDLMEPYEAPSCFKPQTIVSVDVADKTMMTSNEKNYEDEVDLVIDHHKSNPKFGRKYNVIDKNSASCAEMIYDIICILGVKLTPEIARAIYIGVSTDTGCFCYGNTTAHSHQVAAACMAYDFGIEELNQRLFNTKTQSRLNLEKIITEKISFHKNGKIAIVTILQQDRKESGATEDDLESISALPGQIEDVEIAVVLFEQKEGNVKLSVRSNGKVDAALVAEKLGGGGHIGAAGASVAGDINKIKEKVLEAIYDVYGEKRNYHS